MTRSATRPPSRARWTRGTIAMSAVWLATVIGALAMVRVLVEIVSTMGADGGLLVILSMLALVAIAYVSIGVPSSTTSGPATASRGCSRPAAC